MSADEVKDAAEKWLAENSIPEELAGRTVHLVTFASDEDCRFFYPHRVALWQLKLNKHLARKVRQRRGKLWRIELTTAMYEDWRQEQRKADSPRLRRAFADAQQGILPEEQDKRRG